MKFTQQVVTVHEMSLEEFQALELVEKMCEEIQEMYDDDCRLTSPNDGECIIIDELKRVKGILSFLMRNRVVEVDVA